MGKSNVIAAKLLARLQVVGQFRVTAKFGLGAAINNDSPPAPFRRSIRKVQQHPGSVNWAE